MTDITVPLAAIEAVLEMTPRYSEMDVAQRAAYRQVCAAIEDRAKTGVYYLEYDDGKKVPAIKFIRSLTGKTLKDAKDHVECYFGITLSQSQHYDACGLLRSEYPGVRLSSTKPVIVNGDTISIATVSPPEGITRSTW